MGLGIFSLGYSIIIFIISYAISDLNLKLTIIGLGIAVFGVGLFLISSVDSNVKFRKLQDMIRQLK